MTLTRPLEPSLAPPNSDHHFTLLPLTPPLTFGRWRTTVDRPDETPFRWVVIPLLVFDDRDTPVGLLDPSPAPIDFDPDTSWSPISFVFAFCGTRIGTAA